MASCGNKISYGEAERIIDYVDQLWLKKDFEAVGFYNLSGDRMTLIRVLGYARISGFFDDELWEAVEANAPTEAKPIAHEFDLRDITLP